MIHTLISATTALMTSVAPMENACTVIEDRCNLPLLNPDLSDRKVLKLRLGNGLEAILISDPLADQSAASVALDIGSWNDPVEFPGMAHFCEHMLFMGTKKYPNDNEFFSSIADYAGTTNAFTAPNQTVYMFAAQTNGFLTLLDRFAHFFIDPLFKRANIAREMHAVDQEFAKNIEHDGWREYMIFKETGNPNHPNRLFSTGNSETLEKIPQNVLQKWHREKYGAERMHLAIYSPLPLKTLKELVVPLFSEVPKSQSASLDHSAQLSSKQQQGHITFVKPIRNKQTLTLNWELPPELSDDLTKSADLLAYALRRGQKYSLYEKLKAEQLIDVMSTRVDDFGGKQHRFFQITLELTGQGIEQIDTVVLRCFEALAGLRETGVPAYLFQEKNTMAQLHYQYQGRENPFDYITQLGQTLTEEELSTFPRNSLLSTAYAADKIALAISLLTPETCSLSLLASPDVTKVIPNQREKWFGAEYAIQPIPSQWLLKWANAKPNAQILLAEPNPFLPSHLSLLSDSACGSKPIAIANDELGMAFYARSSEFGTPESIYHIHILSPEIYPSALSHTLTSLYIDHLTDVLQPVLTAAHSAGLDASIDLDRSALYLQISGYSEKAPLLLQQIVKEMDQHPPTREQFAIYVARHEKAYLNAQKELAARQAKELLDSLVNQDKTTKKEKLAALKTITYEHFLSFIDNLFDATYIEALFAGNLSLKDAESAYLDVIHVLGKSLPYAKEGHSQTKILQLADLGGPYQIQETTDMQGNATILLVDEGAFTFQRRAIQEVLSTTLKESFSNELRSKQKTGYIAQSEGMELEERLFQYFVVQSNSHQPDDLLFRFEQFIETFNDSLGDNTSSQRFDTIKENLISSLKTRFRNLKDKSALWDRLAFERDGDFDFVEKRINTLSALTYGDFLTQAPPFLARNNRKRLAILFEGKLNTPFIYQPIEVPQMSEIATYKPRPKAPPQETVAAEEKEM